MDDYRKVHEDLFVSGWECSEKRGHEFDAVVSMASPTDNTTSEYLIDDGEHPYEIFKAAVDTVISHLESGDTVLVHCSAGISRSVSVCVAVQVCHYKLSYIEALNNARFGHRNPEPELLESAERYIEENRVNIVEYYQKKILLFYLLFIVLFLGLLLSNVI